MACPPCRLCHLADGSNEGTGVVPGPSEESVGSELLLGLHGTSGLVVKVKIVAEPLAQWRATCRVRKLSGSGQVRHPAAGYVSIMKGGVIR